MRNLLYYFFGLFLLTTTSCEYDEKPKDPVALNAEGKELLNQVKDEYEFEQIQIYRTEDFNDQPNKLVIELWNGKKLPESHDDRFSLKHHFAYAIFPYFEEADLIGIEKFEVCLKEDNGRYFIHQSQNEVLPLRVADGKLLTQGRPLGSWAK